LFEDIIRLFDGCCVLIAFCCRPLRLTLLLLGRQSQPASAASHASEVSIQSIDPDGAFVTIRTSNCYVPPDMAKAKNAVKPAATPYTNTSNNTMLNLNDNGTSIFDNINTNIVSIAPLSSKKGATKVDVPQGVKRSRARSRGKTSHSNSPRSSEDEDFIAPEEDADDKEWSGDERKTKKARSSPPAHHAAPKRQPTVQPLVSEPANFDAINVMPNSNASADFTADIFSSVSSANTPSDNSDLANANNNTPYRRDSFTGADFTQRPFLTSSTSSAPTELASDWKKLSWDFSADRSALLGSNNGFNTASTLQFSGFDGAPSTNLVMSAAAMPLLNSAAATGMEDPFADYSSSLFSL